MAWLSPRRSVGPLYRVRYRQNVTNELLGHTYWAGTSYWVRPLFVVDGHIYWSSGPGTLFSCQFAESELVGDVEVAAEGEE